MKEKETIEEIAERFYSEQSKAFEDAIEPIFDNSRYLVEGFIEGAKWKQEQAKEMEKLTMINALVEFSIEAFDIHTESAILNITRRAEKYYNETFKQQEQ